MLALDLVSLLLSKETPVQALSSLSPVLRERAGIGTLGSDKLEAPTRTAEQRRENREITLGWRLLDVKRSLDDVTSAAERLEKEMAAETRYWRDVMGVKEKGWAVCALPWEKQTLGVRFGFDYGKSCSLYVPLTGCSFVGRFESDRQIYFYFMFISFLFPFYTALR